MLENFNCPGVETQKLVKLRVILVAIVGLCKIPHYYFHGKQNHPKIHKIKAI